MVASAVAQPLDGRRSAASCPARRRARRRAGRGRRRPARAPSDTASVSRRSSRPPRVGGRRDDHRRVGDAGRERLGEPLGGRDRLGLVEELVGLVEPGLDPVTPSGEHGEQHEVPATSAPGAARPRRRPGARASGCRPASARRRAAPAARRPSGRRAPARRAAPPARSRGDHDADRAGQPEPSGGRDHREQQGQQREDDGRGAGEHRLRVAAARAPSPRSGPREPQLVAVAGDQQQRVVRPGAEDQHRQDADGRLVPGDVEGGQRLGGQHRGHRSATPTTTRGTSQRTGLR